ncbi:unnamed protein product [Orchesella dallaii]|uniref:G-protein coupled receptors family 1 profile domain-containing protein n=1 Tax=Orchesella dallaii TaxID=48710 RepID=A0ABP1R6H8_9HEXA
MREALTESSSQSDSEEDSVTPMLFAVVVVFGVCYSFEFYRLVLNFARPEYMSQFKYYDYTINHLADIFYVLNSSVNFCIYCLLGKSFRTVFLKVMSSIGCGWCCGITKESPGRKISSSDALTTLSSSKVSVA